MPIPPTQVWQRLMPTLERRIVTDLTSVYQEICDDLVRTRDAAARAAQSPDLPPPRYTIY
jgi:hypothetical protein